MNSDDMNYDNNDQEKVFLNDSNIFDNVHENPVSLFSFCQLEYFDLYW